MPPGNGFLPPAEISSERSFPLSMGVCAQCHTVQVMDPVPEEDLKQVYRNYSYVPTGATLSAHYRDLAGDIVAVTKLEPGALVVDVGSNDGLLLHSILGHRPGLRVAGVEPATRIAQLARDRGIPTVNRFLDDEAVTEIRTRFGPARIVSATQVFQHLRRPADFLRAVSTLLDRGGVLVIEGRAYFPQVSATNSFDIFYHELLFCYTLTSLAEILRRSGFSIFRASKQSVYGGSLRIYASRTDEAPPTDGSVRAILEEEANSGISDRKTYEAFGSRVATARDELGRMVRDLRSKGMSLSGYGAPSTGSTLLNYCGFGPETIGYIVDDNPLKQGLVTPGTHIPILASSAFRDRPSDYVLVLAWRLRDEILTNLSALSLNGLRGAIVPLPRSEIFPLKSS